MQHFTRSRLAAAITLAGLAALAGGCGGPAAAPFAGNPAFQRQVQPDAASANAIAQQNLVSDLVQLKKDTKALTTETTIGYDLTTLSTDYKTEQQDWQSEQSDGCPGATADARLVSWDAQTVSRDVATLQADLSDMQTGDITSVTTDLANIQNDLEDLKLLGIPQQAAITAQVNSGNQALQTASETTTSATATGKSTSGQSQQILASAQQWAKRHTC